MAQEFASDTTTKNGFFSRLDLSNHRGFFSLIFISLSFVLLLVTFAAVRQQQTTQSKAAGNICQNVNCSLPTDTPASKFDVRCTSKTRLNVTNPEREACCKVQGIGPDKTCVTKVVNDCTGLNKGQCIHPTFIDSCTWKYYGPAVANEFTHVVTHTPDPRDKCVNLSDSTGGTTNQPPPPATTGGTSTIAEKCRSYGLGAKGDVNCAAKAAQNNVKCKWVPTVIGSCSCTAIGQGCSVTGSIPCSGFKCTPTSTGSTVGTCQSTQTTGSALGLCVPETQAPVTNLPGSGTGGGGDSACTSISGRCLTGQTGREGKDCKNIAGQAGSGKIQSGLCSGGADRQCCVPNSTTSTGTKVTCGDSALQTEATCKPVDECVWITQRGTTDTKVCQRACGRIPDQPTCDKRADCGWKNNACISKTGTTGGGTENVDLNLKLSFQGIVSKPKTKTEVKVKVKLVDAANKDKTNDSSMFTVDDNGVWTGKVSFEKVDLSQKYYLLIKGPKNVQKKICGANAADSNPGYYSCQFGNITLNSGSNDFDFSGVKLLVGDIDQNGVVDSTDTSPLFNALTESNEKRQSQTVLDDVDLNYDGIVNPQDWSLMLEALKIKYDEK